MLYITFTYHSVNFSYNTKYAEYNRKFTFLPPLFEWSIWNIICTIYYSNTKILFGLFGTARKLTMAWWSVQKMSDIGCMHLWTQEKQDEDDDDIKMILVGAEMMLHTILSSSPRRRQNQIALWEALISLPLPARCWWIGWRVMRGLHGYEDARPPQSRSYWGGSIIITGIWSASPAGRRREELARDDGGDDRVIWFNLLQQSLIHLEMDWDERER